MPARELQEQLNALRDQLDSHTPLSAEQRLELNALAEQLQAKLDLEKVSPDNNLVDGVHLAVERFEVEHPAIAGTLRNVIQTLGNMGI